MISSRSLLRARQGVLALAAQRSYRASAVIRGGGGDHHHDDHHHDDHHHHMPPPMPPFARNPPKTEPLTENIDALWDDGVAPELALDFDAPNVSSSEALLTWAGAFSMFYLLFQTIKWLTNNAKDNNPALPHSVDVVVPDYSNHAAYPVEKK